MVFFFIAFLITICFFCAPFSIRISIEMSNKYMKSRVFIKIGPFSWENDKTGRKKKKSHKRKFRIGIKKIVFPSFISFRCNTYVVRPGVVTELEKSILGFPLRKAADVLTKYSDAIILTIVDGSGDEMYFALDCNVRYNLYLIFSALLQTIKIGR